MKCTFLHAIFLFLTSTEAVRSPLKSSMIPEIWRFVVASFLPRKGQQKWHCLLNSFGGVRYIRWIAEKLAKWNSYDLWRSTQIPFRLHPESSFKPCRNRPFDTSPIVCTINSGEPSLHTNSSKCWNQNNILFCRVFTRSSQFAMHSQGYTYLRRFGKNLAAVSIAIVDQ